MASHESQSRTYDISLVLRILARPKYFSFEFVLTNTNRDLVLVVMRDDFRRSISMPTTSSIVYTYVHTGRRGHFSLERDAL